MDEIKVERDISVPKEWDRKGLPSWSYFSPSLLELEKEYVFYNHWQIICHTSDIVKKGDFITFDICSERILVIRDNQGKVRAFNNLCRHRGSRVVVDEKGRCDALVCPFHGWVYNLDGSLRGPAKPKSFNKIDKKEFGLKKLDCEVWNGLVFVRLSKGSQPSVKTLMEPFSEELSHYKMDDMLPTNGIWTQKSPVNWKSVRDVDNEGYHVAMAHPSLQDLYGKTYFDEPFVNGTSRTHATFNESGGRSWSVRNYKKISQPYFSLPEKLHKAWIYYGIFPNAVIAVTPESMQFYQEFPISTKKTMLRGATYKYKNETRSQKLARFLGSRIDQDTIDEDVKLTIWSNESMSSKAFDGFYLSDLEYGIKSHHDHLRRLLPILNMETKPKEKKISKINKKLLSKIT